MPHNPDVKYAEEATPEQLDALVAGLKFSVTDGRDRVTWTCPRCDADLSRSFSRDDPVFQFDIETVEAPRDQGVLDFVCDCGFEHEGGSGKPGCGFAANVPVSGQ